MAVSRQGKEANIWSIAAGNKRNDHNGTNGNRWENNWITKIEGVTCTLSFL
jgi:hypothetical protein